jgi:hypothetical protein
MTNYIRRLGAPLALCATVAVAGCTVKDAKSDSSLGPDTALNRDLALAGRDTTAQPQLRDVPATPATTTPAPAPAPASTTPMRTSSTPTTRPSTSGRATTPAPRPVSPPVPTATTTASGNTVTRNTTGSSGGGAVGTIASGTSLSLRSNARVCTNTYQPGQTFTATVANSVSGSNGATIPAGATVSLEVTQLKRSENMNDKIVMEFAVRSVSFGGRTYPVTGSVADADVERVRNQPQSKDVQKVVGGAVIGAIAGQIFGKSTKSTVVGAAAGAAAGAGVAAGTANYEGCLPDGGNVAVTLNAPLQVRITS